MRTMAHPQEGQTKCRHQCQRLDSSQTTIPDCVLLHTLSPLLVFCFLILQLLMIQLIPFHFPTSPFSLPVFSTFLQAPHGSFAGPVAAHDSHEPRNPVSTHHFAT